MNALTITRGPYPPPSPPVVVLSKQHSSTILLETSTTPPNTTTKSFLSQEKNVPNINQFDVVKSNHEKKRNEESKKKTEENSIGCILEDGNSTQKQEGVDESSKVVVYSSGEYSLDEKQLYDMPMEILFLIFGFLTKKNMVMLSRVCKSWKMIVQHLAWTIPIPIIIDQLLDMERLMEELNGSDSLQPVQLNLSQQWISTRTSKNFTKILQSSIITTLIINGNGIKGTTKELAEGLIRNTTLTYLDISHNYILDEGAAYVAHALQYNTTLLHLDLSLNCIGTAGATEIAQSVLHNSTLKELNLAHNCFQGEGAIQIAVALLHNTTLSHLNIANNFFEHQDVFFITQSLAFNTSLKKLDIHYNQIGIEGIRQLVHCNQSLQHLSIGWHSFREFEAKQVMECIKKGLYLKTLELHVGGYLTEKEANEIFKPLLQTSKLQEMSTLFVNSLTKSKQLTVTLKLKN